MFEEFEHITYLPGDVIFEEGEKGDCAYLIESGSVEVTILREDVVFNVYVLG